MNYSELTDHDINNLTNDYIRFVKGKILVNPIDNYDPAKYLDTNSLEDITLLSIIVNEDLRILR